MVFRVQGWTVVSVAGARGRWRDVVVDAANYPERSTCAKSEEATNSHNMLGQGPAEPV